MEQVKQDIPLQQAPQNEPPKAPPTRTVRIQVPNTVSDEQVQMAMELGHAAIQHVNQGVLVMFFPQEVKDPQTGELRGAITQFQVLLSGPEDVNRIVKLGRAITNANMEMVKKAQNPINELAAKVEANRAKDQVLRDTEGSTKGHKGLILS